MIRDTGKIEHKVFKDVLGYFDDKDVMIFNNTKVFPARLFGNKEKSRCKIEVFLLRELNNSARLWDVLVDPAEKSRVSNKLYFEDDKGKDILVAEVVDNTTSKEEQLDSSLRAVMMNSEQLLNYWVIHHFLNTSTENQKPWMKIGIKRFMPKN